MLPRPKIERGRPETASFILVIDIEIYSKITTNPLTAIGLYGERSSSLNARVVHVEPGDVPPDINPPSLKYPGAAVLFRYASSSCWSIPGQTALISLVKTFLIEYSSGNTSRLSESSVLAPWTSALPLS